MSVRVIFCLLFGFAAMAGHAQSTDNTRALPKLDPKPPATGPLSTAPLRVQTPTATPVPVRVTPQQTPSELKTFSNIVISADSLQLQTPNATAPVSAPASSVWDKTKPLKSAPLKLAPAKSTNSWQQSNKPTNWDAKSDKGAWK